MILRTYTSFVTDDTSMHFVKDIATGYQIAVDIHFVTSQFRDFQSSIVQETVASIIDLTSSDDSMFDTVIQ
jgi:hypothetical protein